MMPMYNPYQGMEDWQTRFINPVADLMPQINLRNPPLGMAPNINDSWDMSEYITKQRPSQDSIYTYPGTVDHAESMKNNILMWQQYEKQLIDEWLKNKELENNYLLYRGKTPFGV